MKNKLNDFTNGIISLIVSQILIKIFGVIYSVYITNKTGFGDEGNAIYMSGYQIYALLLTVSSIGVPNAISKLISEKKSQKDIINQDRIFKVSVFLFAIIGSIGMLLLFVFSKVIADKILGIPKATLSLMILSPAVFFVSLNSVFRGYFNGINKIKITAKVQFIEQVLKSIFTIIFVEISSKISNNNTEIMASSANFATTVATCFSLIYIFKKYIESSNIYEEKIIYSKERIISIINKVLCISIPMALNAILSSLGKNIDSITIVRILKNIIGEEQALRKYGIISSKIDILVTMPLSFNSSISTALIPEISRKKAKNDIDGLVNKIKLSILITLMLGIPYFFGVYTYSKEIFEILFPNANDGHVLLKIASFGIVFSMLTQTINSILQGLGNNKVPVFASLLGVIFKVLSNIYLVRIENVYEKGAIIGNIISSFVSFIIVYKALMKNVDLKFRINSLILKPLFGSLVMISFSLLVHNLLIRNQIKDTFSGLISISIAVIIYVFCIFVMKMIKKTDFCEMPENSGFADLKTVKNLKNKEFFEKKQKKRRI